MRFGPGYTNAEYQLFEVPDENLLNKILSQKDTARIKSFKPPDDTTLPATFKPMATLCTDGETYKIKKAESTNNMFVLSVPSDKSNGAEILTKTSLHIELNPTKPKIF